MIARLALAGAACLAYGTFIEARSFRVRRVTLPVLPDGAPELRVLHLSDIHLGKRDHARRRFLASLAGLEPDFVVNTGDNIAHPDALEPLLTAFGRLVEVPGAFVFGSNDYSAPQLKNPLGYLSGSTASRGVPENRGSLPTEELRSGLSSGGWQDLNARKTVVEVRGVKIELRGTDDAHLELDDYSVVSGPPIADADLAVGVTHAPYARVLDAMAADRVRLILAGHTHGGQVCVPGYGALTTNCDLPTAKAKGVSRHGSGPHRPWLHVSAGLGSSPFAPYRFACPPEVTLLTLAPAANG